MKSLVSFVVLGSCLASSGLFAADLQTQLGQLGKPLYDEKFETPDALQKWTRTVGEMKVEQGVLHVFERSQDKHAGAFRYALPVQDCAVQMDFKFDGAKFIHLGFDPAAGELKKKGHLFSVVLAPDNWKILEHSDKNDAKPKNKVLANADTKFEAGRWYSLLLEVKGHHVVAQITGKEPLKGSSPDFHCQKPGLVFRVGGDDGKGASLDNVRVWTLK